MNARRVVISKFEQVTHLSLFVLQTYLRKSHFAFILGVPTILQKKSH